MTRRYLFSTIDTALEVGLGAFRVAPCRPCRIHFSGPISLTHILRVVNQVAEESDLEILDLDGSRIFGLYDDAGNPINVRAVYLHPHACLMPEDGNFNSWDLYEFRYTGKDAIYEFIDDPIHKRPRRNSDGTIRA